jgi:HTH-type transcriptional regulator, sugar sensing transcriptional regulator
MNAEKRIETLTRLGLTLDHARTYLALLQIGQATAKELAEQSKIDRSDMYRIIPTLQQEGLVEKLITRPASFKAASAEQALPFLLKRKNTEQNELNNETNVLICDLANCQEESKEIGKETNFIIVPGKEMIVQKMKDSLLKAKISLCVVTSQKRFSSAIIEFYDGYCQALRRGVKIKIAADQHVALKAATSIVKNL